MTSLTPIFAAPGAARRLLRAAFALTLAAGLAGCQSVGDFFGFGNRNNSGVTQGTPGYVRGFLGGVATEDPAASVIARRVLSAGGSATDAAVAAGFMVGAFGQLPITDYMVGKMARAELRATVYGARYVVTCLVFASAIPVIAWIHRGWGFDTLFKVLAMVAIATICMALLLPGKLPQPGGAAKPVAAE